MMTIRQEFKRRKEIYDSKEAAVKASVDLLNTQYGHLSVDEGGGYVSWPAEPEHIPGRPVSLEMQRKSKLVSAFRSRKVRYRNRKGETQTDSTH